VVKQTKEDEVDEHVAWAGEIRSDYKTLVCNAERDRLFGWPGWQRQNSVKINLKYLAFEC
jgi:hypothetical protein